MIPVRGSGLGVTHTVTRLLSGTVNDHLLRDWCDKPAQTAVTVRKTWSVGGINLPVLREGEINLSKQALTMDWTTWRYA